MTVVSHAEIVESLITGGCIVLLGGIDTGKTTFGLSVAEAGRQRGMRVAYVDAAIDKYIVDGAVNGLASLTWNSGSALRRVQTGHIQSYLFGALGGAIVFVIIQYVIR